MNVLLTAAATGDVSQKAGKHHRLEVVETVGCLTSTAKNSWVLSNATRPEPATASTAVVTDAVPLGDWTLRLLGMSLFNPAHHVGHKVRVQGLHVKDAINVTSLAMLSEVCGK
jgi:hypothetical protein